MTDAPNPAPASTPAKAQRVLVLQGGERDVHLSMRHKDWLERPQSGETMVTRDGTLDGKQE